MKRLYSLLILPLFLLSSCGETTIYGRYSFMLGKESETHIGIMFDLFNEDYLLNNEVKGEKFTFTFDSNQTSSELMGVIGNTFSGYFNVDKNYVNEFGNRLAIGAEITHETLPILPEDFSFDVDPKIIESIIIAFINGKQITVQLPVSLDDLTHQLCWYGYYLDLNNPSFFVKLDESRLPGVKSDARFGTHPEIKKDQFNRIISSEVDMMNDNFANEFSSTHAYKNNSNIGKIAKKSDNNFYFYNNSNTTITDNEIEVTLMSHDIFSDLSYNVKLNLENISGIEYKINTATLVGTEESFDLSSILSNPFVFRDFHDIRVGLVKE